MHIEEIPSRNCSCSVLTANSALTAASCLHMFTPNASYSLKAGTVMRFDSSSDRDAQIDCMHRRYRRSINGIQIGVVTFGRDYGARPSIHARVQLQWIHDNMEM